MDSRIALIFGQGKQWKVLTRLILVMVMIDIMTGRPAGYGTGRSQCGSVSGNNVISPANHGPITGTLEWWQMKDAQYGPPATSSSPWPLTSRSQQSISWPLPLNYQQNWNAGQSFMSAPKAGKGIRFDDDTLPKLRPGVNEQFGVNQQLMVDRRAQPVEYPENNYVAIYNSYKSTNRYPGSFTTSQGRSPMLNQSFDTAYRQNPVISYNNEKDDDTNYHGLTQKQGKSCGVPGAGAIDQLVSGQNSLTRIVGGTDAIPNQICWQVKLSYNGRSVCGGSIIGKRTILTASHCVITNGTLEDPEHYTIQVGAMNSKVTEQTKDPKSCFQELRVLKIIPNSAFSDNASLVNDIALLKLNGDIDFSKPCACPICLRPWIPRSGEICAVSGYGREDLVVRDPTPLKVAHVNILQTDLCDTLTVFNINPLTNLNNLLCAGDVIGEGPCLGDSGGPLVCFDEETRSYYQAGIISFGKYCAIGFAGVFTRLSSYLDWIRRNTQDKSVLFGSCLE